MPNNLAAVSIRSIRAPPDQLQFSVVFLLTLTGRLWRATCTDRLKGLGQSEARWSALAALAGAKGMINQTQLADRLGIEGPSLVRLLPDGSTGLVAILMDITHYKWRRPRLDVRKLKAQLSLSSSRT